MSVVYLDFSKAFNTISCGLFLEKLMCDGLDKGFVQWVGKWLRNWTLSHVVIDASSSNWQLIPNWVPQGLILGPVHFNIFKCNLDDGMKPSREVDTLEESVIL